MISPTDTIYPVLKENLNLYELNSCFLATEDEITLIEKETRSISSKLGFLITLKTFQCLGYFVKVEIVPKNIISFISSQLNIEQFESILIEYDSSRNRINHMDKILQFMSVKNYSDVGDQIVARVSKNTALVRENLSDIINACIETLLHDRIELPAFSRLHREAMNQRAQVYNELYLRIFNNIGENRRFIIDNLFIVDPSNRKSEWENIKFEIGKPKPKEIKKLIKHIQFLNNIIEIDSFFEGIPSIKIEQMAVEAEHLDASDMQRIEVNKKYSLAIALIKIKKIKIY